MIVGLLNSGIQAAWVLIYLGMHPEWLGKIRKEVVAAVEICSPDRHLPFLNRLSQLSFHDWETRFPLIELCLRESIRIQTSGCLFRKNTSGKDLKFGQEKIPAGCFVAYHLRDIHHNPDVYPKPDEWDPDRYGPGPAAFKEKPHGYVGWGAGRYPCRKSDQFQCCFN